MSNEKTTEPLLTNTDLLENMNAYERSLEEHTSYDVMRRLDMTTAYGAGARNVRDIYEAARIADKDRIDELTEAIRLLGVERKNCLRRINPDGSLNHGPTCRSVVPSERTPRDKWCSICNATELLTPIPREP